jgi:hypothetical protein
MQRAQVVAVMTWAFNWRDAEYSNPKRIEGQR